MLVILLILAGCFTATRTPAPRPTRPTLVARAVLPALTLGDGPPSGARVAGGPWPGQPVQGFSGLVVRADGGLLAVADNGYGTPESSADFLLRVYALAPDFDAGTLAARPAFTLSDPDGRLGFPIARALLGPARLLTGADLDIESFVELDDGTFWFGDEHGPFLVHTSADGAVLEPPLEVRFPDGGPVVSPDSPGLLDALLLRTMEAVGAHAAAHGAPTPLLSPFHGLISGPTAVARLHAAGYRVVPWTVNDEARMGALIDAGVDGLISDRPDLAVALARRLGVAGLDVQGHRGARGLAPENTPHAFLLGKEAGATTLELDITATADDEPVVWHDATVGPPKCPAVKTPLSVPATSSELLRRIDCGGRLPQFPAQTPRRGGTTLMTLTEALALPGPLNVETKVHGTGQPHDDARWLTTAILSRERGGLTLQSFDWRSLLLAHERWPTVPTAVLVEDDPSTTSAAARAGLPWALTAARATIGRSAGFENLSRVPGRPGILIAMLEKPVGPGAECLAFEVDTRTRRVVLAFRYPLDGVAVGDVAMIDETTGYALERDDAEGPKATLKALYRFRRPAVPGGLATKVLAADLLALDAPKGTFRFPFLTIEGVAPVEGGVVIVNDNNFPFGRARSQTEPDPTELIRVELPSRGGGGRLTE